MQFLSPSRQFRYCRGRLLHLMVLSTFLLLNDNFLVTVKAFSIIIGSPPVKKRIITTVSMSTTNESSSSSESSETYGSSSLSKCEDTSCNSNTKERAIDDNNDDGFSWWKRRAVAEYYNTTKSIITRGNSEKNTNVFQSHQKKSSNIVKSFVITGKDYDPVPSLKNNHIQTIGGFLLRKALPELKYVKKNDDWISSVIQALGNNIQQRKRQQRQIFFKNGDNKDSSVESKFWDERKRIETPDGDWFHADYKYATDDKKKVKGRTLAPSPSPSPPSLVKRRLSSRSAPGLVILLHGLESNSESALTIEMANGYSKLGMDVVCLNFRGCSGTPNDTLFGYHLGFTDDLRYFLSLVKSRHRSSNTNTRMQPIYLSGFSLGSNVVLKALGELGEIAIDEYNIRGAALQCVPLDQELNRITFEAPGFFRQVYRMNLLKSLKIRIQYQLDALCGGDENTNKFDYARAMAATTISQFDDAVVAPVFGFDNYLDYYRKTSSIFFLDGIAVPTLIVNAKDDPFFDPNVWPVEKSCEGGGTAPIKMIRSENGGHLGFLFHQIEDEDELLNLQLDPLSPSWCSSECARFIKHVHSAWS